MLPSETLKAVVLSSAIQHEIDPLLAEFVFKREPESLHEQILVNSLPRIEFDEEIDIPATAGGIGPRSEESNPPPAGVELPAGPAHGASNPITFMRCEPDIRRSQVHG